MIEMEEEGCEAKFKQVFEQLQSGEPYLKCIHAFLLYKKLLRRNDTLNFGPLETQTLRPYFLKKRDP